MPAASGSWKPKAAAWLCCTKEGKCQKPPTTPAGKRGVDFVVSRCLRARRVIQLTTQGFGFTCKVPAPLPDVCLCWVGLRCQRQGLKVQMLWVGGYPLVLVSLALLQDLQRWAEGRCPLPQGRAACPLLEPEGNQTGAVPKLD